MFHSAGYRLFFVSISDEKKTYLWHQSDSGLKDEASGTDVTIVVEVGSGTGRYF